MQRSAVCTFQMVLLPALIYSPAPADAGRYTPASFGGFMWIEILKILAPSAITTVILGYWFNKKLEEQKIFFNITLEERKMFLRMNEPFLNSLITGLQLLMNDYKAIILKVGMIKPVA